VLYTDPVTPRAGESVTVFYNPDATVLRGRPEVWLRGCWNRWAPCSDETQDAVLGSRGCYQSTASACMQTANKGCWRQWQSTAQPL
jgi:hypothetical protein